MAAVETLSVALPAEIASVVRRAVEAGEYASSSDVPREALFEWTERRSLKQYGIDDLRIAWSEASADGTPGVPMNEVLDRLELKYSRMADAAAEAE